MLLFIICSLRSWIFDSKRLYSAGREVVSAGRSCPRATLPALSRVQLVSAERGDDSLSVGCLAHEPIHPRTQGRTKPKRLQHPVGVQAVHLEQAGHRPLPNPPQTPAQAAWARAAETSTATELQLSKGTAGQGSASC